MVLGTSNALLGSFLPPIHSLRIVLGYAISLVVTYAKGTLGISIALICRFLIPIHSLGIVLGYAISVVVTYAKVILGISIALICSRSIAICILCISNNAQYHK